VLLACSNNNNNNNANFPKISGNMVRRRKTGAAFQKEDLTKKAF